MDFSKDLTSPPKGNEIEISLFGPGYGECIVVHLGENSWLVMDSCINPSTNEPIALSYLKSLGIKAENDVKCIVASHWDNDHIRGLGNLFKVCLNAKFVCAPPLNEDLFKEFIGNWTPRSGGTHESGVEEFLEILAELNRRKDRTNFPAPNFVVENTEILSVNKPYNTSVRAAAPSSAGLMAMVARLQSSLSGSVNIHRRIPRIEANDASIVLIINVEKDQVLLGGDLLVRADRSFGWHAVVDRFKKRQSSSAYKVAHHGSAGADHDDIWTDLLDDDPFAMVTPIVKGRNQIPTIEDCERLIGKTKFAYITAPPIASKYRDPIPAVNRTMHQAAKTITKVPKNFGQIRIRKTIGSNENWVVEMFGSGMHMNDCILLLKQASRRS